MRTADLLRLALAALWRHKVRPLLTLRGLAHVESAWPLVQLLCRVSYNGKNSDVMTSAPASEEDRLEQRLVAGEPLPDYGRSVLLHEYVLYQWGLRSDEDAAAMVGKK